MFVRKDAGCFVNEPQTIYDEMSLILGSSQLPMSETMFATAGMIEKDRARFARKPQKEVRVDLLTQGQRANLTKYIKYLDEHRPEESHSEQAFVVTQNPDHRFECSNHGVYPTQTATDALLWLRCRSRCMTPEEKFAVHGFPTTLSLADKLKVPVPFPQIDWIVHIYTVCFGHFYLGLAPRLVPTLSNPRGKLSVRLFVCLLCVLLSGTVLWISVPSHPCCRKVFEIDVLSSPHKASGNGQHLPVAGVVLASALSSVHLFNEAPKADLMASLKVHELLPVSCDGRCFWTCVALHHVGHEKKKLWRHILRNEAGFPISSVRHQEEAGPSYIHQSVKFGLGASGGR